MSKNHATFKNEPQGLPYPLDWAALTPQALTAKIERGLELARERQKALEELPLESVNYQNFVLALVNFTVELDQAWSIAGHLASVNDSPEIRALMEKYLPMVTEFYSGVAVNSALWTRVKHVRRTARNLTPLQKRHLKGTVKGFRRSGSELSPQKKTEFVAIEKEFTSLAETFCQKNIDAINAFEKHFPDGAEAGPLRGLPPAALALGKTAAKNKGRDGYIFGLEEPSLVAIAAHASSAELRKEFCNAALQCGRQPPFETRAIVARMLELRQRTARLLGYRDFASYTVEERMLNRPAKIKAFIRKLTRKVRNLALAEFDKLKKLKRDLGDASPFEAYDRSYYMERLQERELSLETEALRPYFEFTRVRESLFDLARTLFGIEIRKLEGHASWHPDVEYYEIFDGARLIGGFYTDFFPRPGKRSGAWHNDIVSIRTASDGKTSPGIDVIAGNFMPPSVDTPSLLTHDEVTTLYHEFGHLLHGLLTEVPILSLSGTRVALDFVELPSQLLENYCTNAAYLKKIAHHYKTDEPLDDQKIEQLRALRFFLQGLWTLRQLSFGTLDMYLHTCRTPPADIDAALEKALRDYQLPYHTKIPTGVFSFGHLWGGGYAAGYYSYQWCNVLEADVWGYFEAHGILSEKVGRAYRDAILSRGNSEPAEKLFKRLMGRGPRMEAYLRRLEGKG